MASKSQRAGYLLNITQFKVKERQLHLKSECSAGMILLTLETSYARGKSVPSISICKNVIIVNLKYYRKRRGDSKTFPWKTSAE